MTHGKSIFCICDNVAQRYGKFAKSQLNPLKSLLTKKELKAAFDTLNWDEKPVTIEGTSVKITRVRTEREFTGDLVGHAVTEYVFSYHPKEPDAKGLDPGHPGHGTVSYTGLMYFKGTIDGSEPGEVVFIVANGLYTDAARAQWIVDEKSAIGGLKGLKGTGRYESTSMKGTPAWFNLEI